jgi:hypothetical protein
VWALAAVSAAVLAANLPALLGLVHLDPLNFRAGLTRGLVPGLLGGRPTIDPSNGYNSQAIGHLGATDLLHLQLPWWNPYEATGMPLLGETQSAALFPFTLLTAFPSGQLLEHVLLELIAGLCTYRLLRHLDVVRSAAVAGAVAFGLCGKFAWFSDAGVNPLAFLPMLLLGIERAHDAAGAGRRGGWRLIALAGALTAYAGFPEVAYADLLMAIAWLGWRIACGPAARRGRFLTRIGLGSIAALLLAAPMLLGMVDYLSHADLVSHAGSRLGSRHLPFLEVPQLLMPYVFGPLNAGHHRGLWVMVGGYLSAVLLLLAVVAILTPGRRSLKLVLAGWTLLVFGHMYGVPGLGSVLGALPEMGRIQFYRYATATLELPVILLAALGLDTLTRSTLYRRRALAGAAGGLAAIAAAALAAQPVIASITPLVRGRQIFLIASIGWAALTVVAVAGFALVRMPRLRAAALSLVVVVDAIVLFAVPEFSAPQSTRVDLRPVTYLRDHLGAERFFTLGPIEPNYGSYFRLASLRIDDFPPASFARYVRAHLNPSAGFVGYQPHRAPPARAELLRHLDAYRAVGVRYVLTHPGYGLPSEGGALRLVFRSPTTWIYRLSRAAPFMSASGCQVSAVRIDSARVSCSRPATLVRRETWFAGWSARIDGRARPIRRVDGLFQAVHLPAGSTRVTFHFTPPGMRWALLGLLAGLLLMATPTARGLLTRPAHRNEPDAAASPAA